MTTPAHQSARTERRRTPTPEQREKLRIYPNTVLEFTRGVRIDLRTPIGHREQSALASIGLDEPFAVVTAENPCGRTPDEAGSEFARVRAETTNEARSQTLEAELRRQAIPFEVLDGASPDGSHRERSVAMKVSRHTAETIADALDQLAIFWFDGRQFWLVPVAVKGEPAPLP